MPPPGPVDMPPPGPVESPPPGPVDKPPPGAVDKPPPGPVDKPPPGPVDKPPPGPVERPPPGPVEQGPPGPEYPTQFANDEQENELRLKAKSPDKKVIFMIELALKSPSLLKDHLNLLQGFTVKKKHLPPI